MNGGLDAKSVVLLDEELEKLRQDGYRRFVFNMAKLVPTCSTGLGTLVNIADEFEQNGGALVLAALHPKIKKVFDMLGLDAFFEMYPTEREALDRFVENRDGRRGEGDRSNKNLEIAGQSSEKRVSLSD